jgi:hypothetical protein
LLTATGDSESLPERKPLGFDFGPFRRIANWLLQTESLPLALIVGMIGFGLLGSAASTLVRERARAPRTREDPIVSDLAAVIIRGVSAAILVFLAVEGGSAIFGTTSGEPNPYVIFLTCLVAAVFSETVWENARNRLSEALARRRGRDPGSE